MHAKYSIKAKYLHLDLFFLLIHPLSAREMSPSVELSWRHFGIGNLGSQFLSVCLSFLQRVQQQQQHCSQSVLEGFTLL